MTVPASPTLRWVSAALLFDVFSRHEPGNRLLAQARREVLAERRARAPEQAVRVYSRALGRDHETTKATKKDDFNMDTILEQANLFAKQVLMNFHSFLMFY